MKLFEIQRRLLFEALRDKGELPIVSDGGPGRSETFRAVTYAEWDGTTRSQQLEEQEFWSNFGNR